MSNSYTFRLATMEDFDAVYEMAVAFFYESPYANTFEFSEARVKEVIRIYLTSPKSEAITVLMIKDEVPVGLIAGVACKPLFSEGVQIIEQMWWVDPHHRGTRYCLGLIHLFEEWGRKIGAKYFTLASIKEVTDLTKMYNRLGYTEVEQAFLKKG